MNGKNVLGEQPEQFEGNIWFGYRYQQNPMTVPFRPHAHELWEMLYIVGGNVGCMIEGKRYPLQGNSLILVRPGSVHRVHIEGDIPYEYYSLMFDPKGVLPELTARIPGHVEVIHFRKDPEVGSLFRQMNLSNQQTSRQDHRRVFTMLIGELLHKILAVSDTDAVQTPIAQDPIVLRALSYIAENITELDGIEELCSALQVSNTRLYQMFIRYVLVSPKKYIQVKRLALVQMALRSGENPEQLFARYGYKDYTAFRREFARFYTRMP